MIDKVGLPESWQIVKLKDVCNKIIGGGTPSTNILEYWCGEIPWISSADILGTKEIVPRKKINIEAIENSTTNILPKGSIIIVTRVGLGKLAIAPYDICFSQDCQGLVLNEEILTPMYALVFLSQAVQNFKYESRGTTIKGVTKKQLSELDLSLPPIEEQKRIVSKIEELFSELDKGIESLKTAQQQLIVYQQAVLKWAFDGKLTKNWRDKQKELPDANTLLKAIQIKRAEKEEYLGQKSKNVSSTSIDEIQKLPELPKGWLWVSLAEIGYWNGGGTPDTKVSKYWDNGNILWVSPKDMKLKLIKATEDKITLEAVNNSSAKLINKGSILFVVRSGILRRVLPVAIAGSEITVNQDIQAFSPIEVLPEYIYWFSIYKNNEIRQSCSKNGTTVESIETSRLKRYPISLCSVEEQHQIVQEIESRLSVCDKIEETIEQSLKQAEALRQSILKKAFEGKLVPQDPNDEPVSKLLEKIRAAKQASVKLTTKN